LAGDKEQGKMTTSKIDTDALPDAIVAFMNAVNKLMRWGESVRPTYGQRQWAGESVAILREVAETRNGLAKLCAKEDAGIHSSIWARLANGVFEETLTPCWPGAGQAQTPMTTTIASLQRDPRNHIMTVVGKIVSLYQPLIEVGRESRETNWAGNWTARNDNRVAVMCTRTETADGADDGASIFYRLSEGNHA
jgi:hypothetical protein